MSSSPDMNNLEPPPIPKPLMDWLERAFPPKDFRRDVSLREVDRYTGTRELVGVLKSHFTLQNKR